MAPDVLFSLKTRRSGASQIKSCVDKDGTTTNKTGSHCLFILEDYRLPPGCPGDFMS
jgi:hypothetical protein